MLVFWVSFDISLPFVVFWRIGSGFDLCWGVLVNFIHVFCRRFSFGSI